MAALAILAVVVIALPASLAKRFLPASIHADDFGQLVARLREQYHF